MPVIMTISLDKRNLKKKTGKYPIVLLVSCNGSQRYQTVYEANTEQFNQLWQKRVPYHLLGLSDTLKKVKRDAEIAAEEFNTFSFAKFETTFLLNSEHFVQTRFKRNLRNALPAEKIFDYAPYYKKFPILLLDPVPDIDTMAYCYLMYIKEKIKKGKIGTASNLHSGYVSLALFGGNKRLLEITADYLFDYERWMKEKGKAKATVGIYTRTLRTIYLYAVRKKIIKRDNDLYPFGRDAFVAPKVRKRKKALNTKQLAAIYNYQPKLVTAIRAKDYWFFLFDGNGMNTKDMALLKYKAIQGDYLYFERAKTEDTTRHDTITIEVYITDDMKRTIERWGNKDRSPDNYIFPVLEPGLTPLREYEIIQNFTGYINTWMVRIVKDLGMEPTMGTSGKTRSSRASHMIADGASLFTVQDTLGHHSLTTTQHYIASLESEELKELSKRIGAKIKEAAQSSSPDDQQLSDQQKQVV